MSKQNAQSQDVPFKNQGAYIKSQNLKLKNLLPKEEPEVNTPPHKATGQLVVRNNRGIHTRPATEIAKQALTFRSEIRLKYQRSDVNARSLLGILMLAASKGSKITVEANGVDAEKAVAALLELAANNFNVDY